ncbi:hypothetical protein SAMN05216562_1035 [Microbulbifer marinus]|uniref:Uncharacterized protein n=1 Tax=Microbulbifer marinus TaxID=658218 RepID=A0A1H3WPP0_9GAMM|nr:hypothetical protein SAMN05216562_1035 [Microbulbifer marinus]
MQNSRYRWLSRLADNQVGVTANRHRVRGSRLHPSCTLYRLSVLLFPQPNIIRRHAAVSGICCQCQFIRCRNLLIFKRFCPWLNFLHKKVTAVPWALAAIACALFTEISTDSVDGGRPRIAPCPIGPRFFALGQCGAGIKEKTRRMPGLFFSESVSLINGSASPHAGSVRARSECHWARPVAAHRSR